MICFANLIPHRHYHNSSYYHNNHNHYQGQNYHQYGHQNHHHNNHNNNNSSVGSNSSNNSINGSSHSNSHNHQHQSNHHGNNSHHHSNRNQYYNAHSNGSVSSHHHHNNHHHHNQYHHRNAPPQVFISSDAVDAYTWASRRGGGETANTNWSSPNLVDSTGDSSSSTPSSAVQISLNLSALKQGVYSPSPQNASPATSPSTTDSSDAYSLSQDETNSNTGTGGSTTNGIANGVRHNLSNNNSSSCVDTTTVLYTTASNGGTILDPASSLNGSTVGTTPSNGGVSSTGYSYAPFHPHAGFYTYPGAGHHHHLGGGGRTLPHHHHHHHQLMSQNMSLLMPADSSYSFGKADSSISSNSSDKTVEWSDDGTILSSCTTNGSDISDHYGNSTVSGSHVDNRCPTPEYIYTPFTLSTPTPFTTKKR